MNKFFCGACLEDRTNHSPDPRYCQSCFQVIFPQSIGREQPSDYWGYDNQIFFHSGKWYGLTPKLRTVCLGTEQEAKKRFTDFNLSGDETPPDKRERALRGAGKGK